MSVPTTQHFSILPFFRCLFFLSLLAGKGYSFLGVSVAERLRCLGAAQVDSTTRVGSSDSPDRYHYDNNDMDDHNNNNMSGEDQRYYGEDQYGDQYGEHDQYEYGEGNDGPASPTPNELVLDDIEGQMSKLRSKYPTSEADYLAAARARNAARVSSVETRASDEDWLEAKREAAKKQGGQVEDDWDSSLSEAGNIDSQILIPLGEDDDPDSDEPKLLLF